MSQHEYTFRLESLHNENLRLLQHIDYLEERLSNYEDVPEVEHTTNSARNEKPQATDEWNVWPYSWATSVWQTTSERLHSFHGKLGSVRAPKGNGRGARCYETRVDEGELALMR